MKVFVIAMECEADAVSRCFEDASVTCMCGRKVIRGRVCGEDAALIVAGIGKVNAAAGTQIAISSLGADAIINVGVAGGLDPSLRVSDACRVVRAVEYDFDLSKVNGTAVGVPDERNTPFFALASSGAWPEATAATGDRFTDDDGDIAFLRREFGATVRDMELGAIAHVASRAGIPVHSLKVITDVVGQGSMTGQYKSNLSECLDVIACETPLFFASAK